MMGILEVVVCCVWGLFSVLFLIKGLDIIEVVWFCVFEVVRLLILKDVLNGEDM